MVLMLLCDTVQITEFEITTLRYATDGYNMVLRRESSISITVFLDFVQNTVKSLFKEYLAF